MAALTFRPLTSADLPMLHEWRGRPHVARWWGPAPSFAELEAEFAPSIAGTVAHWGFIALRDGVPIGFTQAYAPAAWHDEGWWPEEHDPGVRGIDQFLADAGQLGQGLGTAMVRAFVAQLLRDPDVTRVQTDPAPDNGRAIRCYEKAGFRAAGKVITRDGPALLMYCERPGSDATG
jgi:Acetyltransferases, including N-acetylases of ribosomal proteins